MGTAKLTKIADDLAKKVPAAEGATSTQIDTYKQLLEQADDAARTAEQGRAVVASKLPKVLFTKCLPATMDFNKSGARMEHDFEEGALCAASPRVPGSGWARASARRWADGRTRRTRA
tara:strand:- start:1481 stop:1834 length:354 start_codon:yes stop_codon:yes gene_type:complete